MTDTTFQNHTANQDGTLTDAAWFQDLNDFYYTIFGTPSISTQVFDIAVNGDVSILDTVGGTPFFFDVSANQLQIGKGLTTQTARLEIGTGRTGNGYSYIDLGGDPTYPDYGARFIRGNSGANAGTSILHRGTGTLLLHAEDTGNIGLTTNAVRAITVDASQNIKIGTTTTMGTSAAKVLGIDIGTEPSTSPAGMIQMYAKDSSDGTTNATLAFRTEQAVEAIGTFTASHKLKLWINGVEYWVQLDAV